MELRLCRTLQLCAQQGANRTLCESSSVWLGREEGSVEIEVWGGGERSGGEAEKPRTLCS